MLTTGEIYRELGAEYSPVKKTHEASASFHGA
jgi:hypothetical protein